MALTRRERLSAGLTALRGVQPRFFPNEPSGQALVYPSGIGQSSAFPGDCAKRGARANRIFKAVCPKGT